MARLRARLREVCPELVADIARVRQTPGCEGARLVRLTVGAVAMGEPASDPDKVFAIPESMGRWDAAEAARKAKKARA